MDSPAGAAVTEGPEVMGRTLLVTGGAVSPVLPGAESVEAVLVPTADVTEGLLLLTLEGGEVVACNGEDTSGEAVPVRAFPLGEDRGTDEVTAVGPLVSDSLVVCALLAWWL